MAYVSGMRKLLLPLLMLLPLAALATDVYRYVDERGNVVFTDKPASGAKKITVDPAPATSVVIPNVPSAAPAQAEPSARPGSEPFTGYADMRITQPVEGEGLVSTAGDIDVSINLHPALRADLGHGLTVMLDGQPVIENTSRMNIALNNVDRGEHVLQAYVVDAQGQMLIKSATVRFSLQRASLLMPGRQQVPGAPLNPIPSPVPQPR